jgi:hypothetical protein
MFRILVLLSISALGGALGGWMWSKVSKPSHAYLSWYITIVSGTCLLLGLFGLRLNSTSPVYVMISTPAESRILESQMQIEGTVSPPDSRVYILVRPEDSNVWWAQPAPVISGDGALSGTAAWTTTVYLGNEQDGQYKKFEVVALASTNLVILDFLNGDYLIEGDAIKDMPLLSRSNVILILRR